MILGKIKHKIQEHQQQKQANIRRSQSDIAKSETKSSEIDVSQENGASETESTEKEKNEALPQNEPSVEASTSVNIPPFYLNILLLNKQELVGGKITEMTGNNFLGRAAVYAANKMISDEKIITDMAEKLIEGVSKTIEEVGIVADFSIKFTKGSFVVIKIQIMDIDTLQLILSAKGPEFASNFTRLLISVEKLGMTATVLDKVNTKIHSSISEGMINKFNALIPQKMSEKGVHVDCHACTTEEQAEIFFYLHDRLMEMYN